jgi:hypothetical protein
MLSIILEWQTHEIIEFLISAFLIAVGLLFFLFSIISFYEFSCSDIIEKQEKIKEYKKRIYKEPDKWGN